MFSVHSRTTDLTKIAKIKRSAKKELDASITEAAAKSNQQKAMRSTIAKEAPLQKKVAQILLNNEKKKAAATKRAEKKAANSTRTATARTQKEPSRKTTRPIRKSKKQVAFNEELNE
jgi:hypothetical protein